MIMIPSWGPASRREHIMVAMLCVATALAFGLSYGWGGNHATYIPPGIRLADEAFLAHDWWATEVPHYHWAFFALVAGLHAPGGDVLPWGLAILNVLTIAASLGICAAWLRLLLPSRAWLVFGILAAWFLSSDGFSSVGMTYLFSPSMQASSVSMLATLWALSLFLRQRYSPAGFVLAAGGVFHSNFLLLNVPLFGLAYGLAHWFARFADPGPPVATPWRKGIGDVLLLLGPSLIAAAVTVPLILSIAGPPVDPQTSELAQHAFFRFRAPHHYLPRTFPMSFLDLAGWQLIGAAWTSWAVRDLALRRRVWAFQIALAVLLWAATASTTIVFVEAVSRLFVWRLAPIAILVAVILFLAGTFRALQGTEIRTRSRGPTLVTAAASIVGLLLVARYVQFSAGLGSLKGLLLVSVPAVLMLLVAAKWGAFGSWATRGSPVTTSKSGLAMASILVTALWILGSTAHFDVRLFSLVASSPRMDASISLCNWARQETADDARFATPPEMEEFRLFAARSIVADYKSVPMGDLHVAEWYRRLEDLSAVERPTHLREVVEGYRRMDGARAAMLRQKYGVTHIVLPADHAFSAADWSEAFRNELYRVLQYR